MLRNFGIAAIGGLALLTTACEKAATGQSVAVVNGEEVSQSELNSELERANIPESANKEEVQKQLLQRVIDRKLMAQNAVEQGVDRSPEYIARQHRLNEELLVQMLSQRQAETVKIPTQQEIDAFIAENPAMFGQREVLALNQLQFNPPANMALLEQLRDDHSLEEVAESLTGLGIPFQRGNGRLDTASIPAGIRDQINNLPPGEPFAVPFRGRIVVSVISGREPVNMTPEAMRSAAAETLRRRKVGEMLENQLKQLRASAEIEYQSGYAPDDKAAAPKGKAAAPKQGEAK